MTRPGVPGHSNPSPPGLAEVSLLQDSHQVFEGVKVDPQHGSAPILDPPGSSDVRHHHPVALASAADVPCSRKKCRGVHPFFPVPTTARPAAGVAELPRPERRGHRLCVARPVLPDPLPGHYSPRPAAHQAKRLGV